MPDWLHHLRRRLSAWRAPPLPRGYRGLRLEWWLFCAALLALVWWMSSPGMLTRINLQVQDLADRAQQKPATPEIVLIAIDDRSIDAIGRWPWRRAIHAQLIRQLSEVNPKAIGMDILFSEEDLDYPTDDILLANAVADSGKVALPIALNNDGRITLQMPALRNVAAAYGHVQLLVDQDGGVRSFTPRITADNQTYLHLGLAMRCVAEPQDALCTEPMPQRLHIGFASGMPTFTTYSYIDVVRGTIPASAFRGKYVLIGHMATGLTTAVPTPSREIYQAPNVIMVGQILNGVLQSTHTHNTPASPTVNHVINTIPVVLALLALALLGPSAALAACVLIWGATLLFSTMSTVWWHIAFEPAAALTVVAIAYPLWSWRRLNAAARFLEHEMRDLRSNAALAPMQAARRGQDVLAMRIEAVEQASRQLRELHHFVSESLLQLPSPTLVCDEEGHILLANSAAHRYAYTLGIKLQERQPVQTLMEGAVERETQQPLLRLNADTASVTAFQREGTDRMGNHLLLVGRPFSAPPTKGWLLTLVDITSMRQAIAQRDQAMHFISHDIRAPIGAIVTLLEMQRSFGTPPNASGVAAAGTALPSADTEARIERYARSALALADDFVHLARAQQQPPRQEPVELGQLLDQSIDEIWALAQSKSIDVEWLPQEAEAFTTGDPGQLRRVFVNMLSNAIKYSPAGSSVHCAVLERPAHWVVEIRDEGDGISPEQQATLFAPFTRMQQHENSKIQGVGLGLAFVHTVMKRHGANIELHSVVGEGSSFKLVFGKRTAPDAA